MLRRSNSVRRNGRIPAAVADARRLGERGISTACRRFSALRARLMDVAPRVHEPMTVRK